MIDSISIRRAAPHEAHKISDLGLRSKAYWGYSTELMDAFRKELTVSEKSLGLTGIEYWVAEYKSVLVAYYAIGPCAKTEYELEALFVEPEYIGKGIGRLLVEHAKNRAGDLGANALIIQGEVPSIKRIY